VDEGIKITKKERKQLGEEIDTSLLYIVVNRNSPVWFFFKYCSGSLSIEKAGGLVVVVAIKKKKIIRGSSLDRET